jgi:hypothetical protein
LGPVLAIANRIDPDEYAIEFQKLLAHIVCHFVGIDRWLRANFERGQRLENAIEPIVLCRRFASCLTIPAPEQRQLASFTYGHVKPSASLRRFLIRPEAVCQLLTANG